MIEEIKREEIPASVDGLIEFWSQKGIVERSQPEPVQADILNYLQWVGYLLGEVERLEGVAKEGWDIANELSHQVSGQQEEIEELQKVLKFYADENSYVDYVACQGIEPTEECESCQGFGYFFTGVEASESQKERVNCADCDGWGYRNTNRVNEVNQ